MPRFLGQVPSASDARAIASDIRAAVAGRGVTPRLAAVAAMAPPVRQAAAAAAAQQTDAAFARAMTATGLSEQQLKTVLGAVAVQAARTAQFRARFMPQTQRLAIGNAAARTAAREILQILATGAGGSVATAGLGGYHRT